MSGRRDVEADFDVLINLMAEMIDVQAALVPEEGDRWIADLQSLSVKLFKQLCSARRLLEPMAIMNSKNQVLQIIDHSSVIVISRACIESYIAMHWIFGDADIEHRRFKHKVWTLAGLYDRLGLHSSTEEGRVKQAQTEIQKDALMLEVQISPFLQFDYTEKQRNRVLKGDWRINWSWTEQAVRAGFHRKYFESVYSHYCGYAHSSYISAMQVSESAQSLDDQHSLALAALQTGVHILAHFLHFYSSILDAPRRSFQKSVEARKIADIWHFSAENMNFLYEPKEDAPVHSSM